LPNKYKEKIKERNYKSRPETAIVPTMEEIVDSNVEGNSSSSSRALL